MAYVLSAFADEASSNFAEQMDICEENSVKHIEIRGVNGKNISDLTVEEAKDIKSQIDERGFFISSIGSPFGKIGINDDFEPHLEKFKKTIEIANILESKYMRLFSFFMPNGENYDNYAEKVFFRLEQFLKNSAEITLCHENEKGIFGDIPERCKQIYDKFDGKIKLIFDPANFIQCGTDIETAYNLLNDAVEYFHIKDCLYKDGFVVPAGEGDGKIEWLINQFASKKTDKTFLSIEPHLKVFKGFSDLEKDNDSSINTKYTYESNELAFSTAVMALKTILCANSYIQTKDFGRGYGEWIR